MKVLWLGSSNDVNDAVPEPQRTIAVAATQFTQATGVPIEVEFRKIWPGPELPALVERWLGRYEPDMVVIHTNSYWFTYESTPEKLRRTLGPAGPIVAGIGSRAAENPTLSQNGVFRALRRNLTRTICGDVAIKGPACVAMMEEMIHRIVAREDTVLLVRGPHYPHDPTGTAAGRQRAFDACRVVSDGLEAVCEKLHVEYWKRRLVRAGAEDSDDLLDDDLHISLQEHMDVGEKEAEWMVKAWRQAHPGEQRNA